MKDLNKAMLQIPQGTESFSLEEAFKHKKIVNRFSDLFSSWGYLPAQTPVFDFYDSYTDLINDSDVYRLIDRDGDLLVLRSDITLFLAKQLCNIVKNKELPMRVFYSDTILRHQDDIDISKNEFFQTGAELIGQAGEKGNIEILLLLLETLETIEKDFYIHIGSSELFDIIFCEGCKDIKEAVRKREKSIFLELTKDIKNSEKLYDLFSFIGNSSEFKEVIKNVSYLEKDAVDELNNILDLVTKVETANDSSEIRIDLSTVGKKDYYTGMVFEVFTEGADSAVAAGGRYDNLLKKFGYDVPSVGFSILQRKIEALLPTEAVITKETLSGDDIIANYKKAKELRANGGIIELC